MKIHDAFTDFHDTADTGRIMTGVVLGAMIVIQLVSTITSPTHEFNAQNFGIGCGAVIGALAAYIWGDAKGQQISGPMPGTVTDTTKRVIEVTPPPPPQPNHAAIS